MRNPLKKILIEISYYNGKYLLPPKYICLNLTFRCNFRCLSCNIWQTKIGKELETSDWIKIIKQLHRILPPSTAIEISGGEPMLEGKKIIQITKEIKKYFNYISINTNGSLLNEADLQELKKAGLNAIKLSFYSLDPIIHNELKGNSKAYYNAVKTIKLASKSNLNLFVAILITNKNINSIPSLIKYLANKSNVEIILQPIDEIILSPKTKILNNNYLPQNLWPKKKDVIKLFQFLDNNQKLIKNRKIHLKEIKKYYLMPKKILKTPCFVGQNSLIINPDGEVKFCFKQPSLGNAKYDSIASILRSNSTIKKRREIKNCCKLCRVLGCYYSPNIKTVLKYYLTN